MDFIPTIFSRAVTSDECIIICSDYSTPEVGPAVAVSEEGTGAAGSDHNTPESDTTTSSSEEEVTNEKVEN